MIVLVGGLLVPTPPHPIWRFRKFTGRSQLLGVPSYWAFPWPGGGGGGGARPWPSGAGGEESGAGSGPPRPGPVPVHVRAIFFVPSAAWPLLGAAAARPWPNK